jgi:uncharacterized phage infection (PIP) family protein YhgE
MTMTLRCACFLTATCVLPLLAGCKREAVVDAKSAPEPSGLERTMQAAQSMESVRGELQKGKLQIDATLAALASVIAEAEGKPRPYFESMVKGIGELETQAAAARKRADEMHTRGQAYFDGWVKDLKAISSESVRDVAAERLEDLKASYDEITEASAKVGKAYQPFISQLTEVKKTLDNDFTAKGIEQLSDQAKQASKNGDEVKEAIDELNEKLNELSERIAGTKKH